MSDDRTSLSLLEQLIQQPDAESWIRLANLYSPLLRHWLQRYAIQAADADDLIQDVLLVVSRELPQFQHNRRPGAFRNWLRTILVHRLRQFWRSRQYRPVATGNSDFMRQLDELADPDGSSSRIWEQQHDHYVVQRVLEQIRTKVTTKTWEAFHRLAIHAEPASAVAAELEMSLDAVYAAKSRVLKMLRQEAEGLID